LNTAKPPKYILVVDDSADNRDLLKLYLEAQGMRVDCAPDGSEALAILNSAPTIPDCILLDSQMPVMDGPTFRIAQLANERLKDIPVVVMSGESDFELKTRMLDPYRILQKPLQLSSLLGCL
jgi:CheY-like chemotaxis protein